MGLLSHHSTFMYTLCFWDCLSNDKYKYPFLALINDITDQGDISMATGRY